VKQCHNETFALSLLLCINIEFKKDLHYDTLVTMAIETLELRNIDIMIHR